MPDRATAIAGTFELSLLVAGSMLAWRLALSPAARQRPSPPRLPRWNAPPAEFFLFLWLICSGGVLGSLTAGFFSKQLAFSPTAIIAIGTAGGQLGMLSGIAIFRLFLDRHKTPPIALAPNFILTGITTFLIAMPLVTITGLVWQALLNLGGLPAEKQDLIRMFLEVKSPTLLAVMIILACVGAPLAEELVFRAGLFNYARTRLPRWAALTVPAVLFAVLHQNLASVGPLVALGILFSLAYERTGRIGTSIVAHALFNLNSLVLVLAKVDL